MLKERLLRFGAVFALSWMTMSAPAQATLVDVIWTGTVVSGADGAGLFHTGTQNLANQSYTAYYRFDTILGRFLNSNSDQSISGGTSVPYYTVGPAILSSLTINGKIITIGNKYFSNYARHHRSLISLNTEVRGPFFNTLNQDFLTESFVGYGGLSTPLDAPFTKALTVFDNPYGVFQKIGSNGNVLAYGTLKPSFVSVYLAPTAVPEPASWALMIAGFAMVGGALRRRHSPASGLAAPRQSA